MVLRIDSPEPTSVAHSHQKSSILLRKLASATAKPGAKRHAVFHSDIGKKVFAYSIYPADLSKIVREDETGKKTLGRFVNGTFRRT